MVSENAELSADSTSPATVALPGRSDGQAARARLLAEALRLFAEQGFARTSTRAIAQAAGVNISAISYYFGDKEGLYRAAFYEPLAEHKVHATIAEIEASGADLDAALRTYFNRMLIPLAGDTDTHYCMRLRMRETLEPTGLRQEEIDQRFIPLHRAMHSLLARHLGLDDSDEGVDRLVLAIMGMPIYLVLAQDVVLKLCPAIVEQPDAVAKAVDTLVRYALALIQSEAAQRGTLPKRAP
ncbi:MAG: CerR family C-terminal domain-containing protein [Brachymonas sp.]|nr:CerR family C-terminal domain-containing protein [Brachymonas sp.]